MHEYRHRAESIFFIILTGLYTCPVLMLHQHAGVLDNIQAGCGRFLGRCLIGDSQLHPDRLRATLDGLIHERGNVLAPLKEKHQINRLGDIIERSISRVAVQPF